MTAIQTLPPDSLVVGWDFSTGAVKALAFDLSGRAVAEVRLPDRPLDRGRRQPN